MQWEPVLDIDEIFRSMQANTLILKSNAKDSILLEDYKFVHDNNNDARIEFTTGIRDIITKDQIRVAEELSNKVTKIMKTLASEVGGSLEGLEFRLKSEESLNRKFRDWEDGTGSGLFSSRVLKVADESIHDVLRFTILFDHNNFTLKYLKSEQFLRKNKMYFVKVKNTFDAEDTYKGVNTFVMAKDEKYNYIFELQFHTKQSFDAKMKTHDYYEIERNSMSSSIQKDEAHEAQARIFAAVPSPDNYDMIKEFDMLDSENVGVVKE